MSNPVKKNASSFTIRRLKAVELKKALALEMTKEERASATIATHKRSLCGRKGSLTDVNYYVNHARHISVSS